MFRTMAALNHRLNTARQPDYPGGVKRFPVPDDKVSWSVNWPEYKPVDYTAPRVLTGPVWADPDFRTVKTDSPLKYNDLDGKVDRRSHTGTYKVVDGLPQNPIGRTGIIGRGLLGRWGPNHAVDPIVTRWKRDGKGDKVMVDGKPLLEFVAIKRRDNNAWAIPGGMVDPGDTVSQTLKKEFGEEAMNSLEASDEEKKRIEEQIASLFREGQELYSGYVDDPRNTDNSWTETVAVNFHDDTGELLKQIKLSAGDDAGAVAWKEVSSKLAPHMHASHLQLVQAAAKLRQAAWS